jgi:hypothetical protein
MTSAETLTRACVGAGVEPLLQEIADHAGADALLNELRPERRPAQHSVDQCDNDRICRNAADNPPRNGAG